MTAHDRGCALHWRQLPEMMKQCSGSCTDTHMSGRRQPRTPGTRASCACRRTATARTQPAAGQGASGRGRRQPGSLGRGPCREREVISTIPARPSSSVTASLTSAKGNSIIQRCRIWLGRPPYSTSLPWALLRKWMQRLKSRSATRPLGPVQTHTRCPRAFPPASLTSRGFACPMARPSTASPTHLRWCTAAAGCPPPSRPPCYPAPPSRASAPRRRSRTAQT